MRSDGTGSGDPMPQMDVRGASERYALNIAHFSFPFPTVAVLSHLLRHILRSAHKDFMCSHGFYSSFGYCGGRQYKG